MPTLTVKGMSCNHCKQAVATWKESQPLDIAEVKKAINKLGFEA